VDCEAFHTDLPDLIYGELSGDRKHAGEAHMASCALCTELVSDLQTVRTAQRQHLPSPLLSAKIKLAARDELLDEQPTPVLGRGGYLHLATVGVLAACVGLAGFALGIAYDRDRPAPLAPPPFARKTPPSPPPSFVPLPARDDRPLTIEISDGSDPDRPVRRDPEAWQRSMEDAGRSHLGRGEWTKAREFFLAAVDALPEGPRASYSLAGAAEALLRAGDKATARAEIETLRRRIMAGSLEGDAALLQRLLELSEDASQ
jgi:hypothetical protein